MNTPYAETCPSCETEFDAEYEGFRVNGILFCCESCAWEAYAEYEDD